MYEPHPTGNIAIGNLPQFLPVLVKMVQNDAEKRLLSLHSLKEVGVSGDFSCIRDLITSPQVVTHCSHGQLEGSAETLWTPLFDNSENSEEITRNVAAACLGKLSTTNPSKYLPQLHVSGAVPSAVTILTAGQNRITDANPAGRATVVAAIRYTFAESSPAFDELLGPMLIDFLSLMLDPDLVSTFS